jgi:hypothetical protein
VTPDLLARGFDTGQITAEIAYSAGASGRTALACDTSPVNPATRTVTPRRGVHKPPVWELVRATGDPDLFRELKDPSDQSSRTDPWRAQVTDVADHSVPSGRNRTPSDAPWCLAMTDRERVAAEARLATGPKIAPGARPSLKGARQQVEGLRKLEQAKAKAKIP